MGEGRRRNTDLLRLEYDIIQSSAEEFQNMRKKKQRRLTVTESDSPSAWSLSLSLSEGRTSSLLLPTASVLVGLCSPPR